MWIYVIPLLGLVYYALVVVLSKRFNFKRIHGLWLPVILNILGIIGVTYASFTDSTGWATLGYLIMEILALGFLLVYVISWGIHVLIEKSKK